MHHEFVIGVHKLSRVMTQTSDTELVEIKERMRQALDGRPLTWLVEKTGDRWAYVQRWVNGKTQPPIDFFGRFAEATEVSLEWLLLNRGPRKPVPLADAQIKLEAIRKILEQDVRIR